MTDCEKLRTDVAPNFGVHCEGIHKEYKTTHEKPGVEEREARIHAVYLPW
jgi:hypothetical protein